MASLGLEDRVVNRGVLDRTIAHFAKAGILLPTFAQLAEPWTVPASIGSRLSNVGPDDAHPLNLFRVHWYNDDDRGSSADVPGHLILPEALTGVPAKIVVLLGDRFPMIGSHKVLAAYGCLAPRVISGQYDPSTDRAIWPSTGNYCRGGIAISRIMDCRGVAVLPEEMSRERFAWLAKWAADPSDIIRTPGSESNVKEIYDACNELDREPKNIIFNQFSEFGNHLIHYLCTGRAVAHVFETMKESRPELTLRGFVSATGSAGTLGAGDYLKDAYGTRILALEALECPTLLYNGFGTHNIQGIGDKHVPLIHNVMNTDFVAAISDAATDCLQVVFNTEVGRDYLVSRRGLSDTEARALGHLGYSGICNVLGAIKLAKYLRLDADAVVMTVATDNAAMYESERNTIAASRFPRGLDTVGAAEATGRYLDGIGVDHLLELSAFDRDRVFNLGYFTWVEQQGVSLADFEKRRDQAFWRGLRDLVGAWDEMIDSFNAATGV